MLNKVQLIGFVGKDADLRSTNNGSHVCNFNVATTETWKDKTTGGKKEATEWHRCVAFSRLAEICGQFLTKGKGVYIEGRLQTREWNDRDGARRFTTEIVVSQMRMLPGQKKQNNQPYPQKGGEVNGNYPASGPFAAGGDDIPF